MNACNLQLIRIHDQTHKQLQCVVNQYVFIEFVNNMNCQAYIKSDICTMRHGRVRQIYGSAYIRGRTYTWVGIYAERNISHWIYARNGICFWSFWSRNRSRIVADRSQGVGGRVPRFIGSRIDSSRINYRAHT
jgi:hypothetical protein